MIIFYQMNFLENFVCIAQIFNSTLCIISKKSSPSVFLCPSIFKFASNLLQNMSPEEMTVTVAGNGSPDFVPA